jgi:hypothetical protein
MILTSLCSLAIVVVAFAERSQKYLVFAIAEQCFLASAFALVVGDYDRAVLLTCLVTVAVAGASAVKYEHSGLKLTVTDLPLLAAGTVPFFFVQYPRAVASVIAGAVALGAIAAVILLYAAGASASPYLRVFAFALAVASCVLIYRSIGGAAAFRRTIDEPRGFFSTFMASLLDVLSWQQINGFTLSDISRTPLPLLAAVPARSDSLPDVIFIQHESIFDPRLYGLPLEPVAQEFLSPEGGLHGRLHVDIFGGGSWQSEFSVLTGLSSASFGPNAYFLYKKGVGRFHHSLPRTLSALGYRTQLVSSCRRDFLNYDAFYRSIGVNERIFTDDLPPPFDADKFEPANSDAVFLPAALDAVAAAIKADAAPRLTYVLTNFNHGPHSRRSVPPGQFERERAFASASLPDPQYAEYYARLAETAATWQRVKADLTARFPDRPMLIVHYGDHQPVMARSIAKRFPVPNDTRRQFRTFYAIEALNMAAGELASGRGRDLDIAFLGTIALQQAGLPLDPVFATRASLLDECGEAYFLSNSRTKRRFHRTLVDLALIDCDAATSSARSAPLQGLIDN